MSDTAYTQAIQRVEKVARTEGATHAVVRKAKDAVLAAALRYEYSLGRRRT